MAHMHDILGIGSSIYVCTCICFLSSYHKGIKRMLNENLATYNRVRMRDCCTLKGVLRDRGEKGQRTEHL